jgi:hypothetical protein
MTTATMHVRGYTWHWLVVVAIILVILECIWSRWRPREWWRQNLERASSLLTDGSNEIHATLDAGDAIRDFVPEFKKCET